jgi:hypothetical protein
MSRKASVCEHVDDRLQLAEKQIDLPVEVRLDVVVNVLTVCLHDRVAPAA